MCQQIPTETEILRDRLFWRGFWRRADRPARPSHGEWPGPGGGPILRRLQVGQMLILSRLMPHASGPNTSDSPRRTCGGGLRRGPGAVFGVTPDFLIRGKSGCGDFYRGTGLAAPRQSGQQRQPWSTRRPRRVRRAPWHTAAMEAGLGSPHPLVARCLVPDATITPRPMLRKTQRGRRVSYRGASGHLGRCPSSR